MGIREEYEQSLGEYIEYGRAVALLSQIEDVSFSFSASWLIKRDAHQRLRCYKRADPISVAVHPMLERGKAPSDRPPVFVEYSPPKSADDLVITDGPFDILYAMEQCDHLWWDFVGWSQRDTDANQRWKRDEFWQFVIDEGVAVTANDFEDPTDCPFFLRGADFDVRRRAIGAAKFSYKASTLDWQKRALEAEAALKPKASAHTTASGKPVAVGTTILDRIRAENFPEIELNRLRDDRSSSYLRETIFDSADVVQKACLPWEFKSLAQLGTEDFARRETPFWIFDMSTYPVPKFDTAGWIGAAKRELARSIYRYVIEAEDGLVFFVKTENEYRAARPGDAPFDFALRLKQEDLLDQLVFDRPPTWTHELYINKANLETYFLVWSSEGDKGLKTSLILRETERLLGDAYRDGISQSHPLSNTSFGLHAPEKASLTKDGEDLAATLESSRKTIEALERDQLLGKGRSTALKIIGGLAMGGYGVDLHAGRFKGIGEIVNDMSQKGVVVDEDTLRAYLKEAADLIERQGRKSN